MITVTATVDESDVGFALADDCEFAAACLNELAERLVVARSSRADAQRRWEADVAGAIRPEAVTLLRALIASVDARAGGKS